MRGTRHERVIEFSTHHLCIIKESEKAVRTVDREEFCREAQMTITMQTEGVSAMQTWDCRWHGDRRLGLKKPAEKRA